MVPKQEDEAETGGPGAASRVPVCPYERSAAASAVSAPRPEWTAPRRQRLLPTAAAAPQVGPAGSFAPPAPLHGCLDAPTLLLNSDTPPKTCCLESRYFSNALSERGVYTMFNISKALL